MGSRGENMCFYSNKCKWSKQFIEALSKTPYFNEFTFVCIDQGQYKGRLPDFLKQTPTIVIKGERDPRINDAVMGWLFDRASSDMNNGLGIQKEPPRRPMPGITQGQVQNHPSGPAPQDGPSAFNVFEMGSSKQDNYTFIDDNLQSASMLHSFEFLSPMGGGASAAAVQQQNDANKTQKEKAFDSAMERYMKERETTLPYQPIVRK